jgi:hypothetical protein
MRARCSLIFFVAVVSLAGRSSLACAQVVTKDSSARVTAGRWTGFFASPGGKSRDVEAIVSVVSDTTLMDLVFAPEPGRPTTPGIPTRSIQLVGDTLTFEFSGRGAAADVIVRCRLLLSESQSFTGTCRGSDGIEATVTLVPPPRDTTRPWQERLSLNRR